MGYSKVVADRILLDLKSLVISLMFLRSAVRNGRTNTTQKLIKSIKIDIEKINKAPHLLGSFEAIYHNNITPKDIEKIIKLIEDGRLPEANREIDKLNHILGEELSEGFASARYYPEVRPINI